MNLVQNITLFTNKHLPFSGHPFWPFTLGWFYLNSHNLFESLGKLSHFVHQDLRLCFIDRDIWIHLWYIIYHLGKHLLRRILSLCAIGCILFLQMPIIGVNFGQLRSPSQIRTQTKFVFRIMFRARSSSTSNLK